MHVLTSLFSKCFVLSNFSCSHTIYIGAMAFLELRGDSNNTVLLIFFRHLQKCANHIYSHGSHTEFINRIWSYPFADWLARNDINSLFKEDGQFVCSKHSTTGTTWNTGIQICPQWCGKKKMIAFKRSSFCQMSKKPLFKDSDYCKMSRKPL